MRPLIAFRPRYRSPWLHWFRTTWVIVGNKDTWLVIFGIAILLFGALVPLEDSWWFWPQFCLEESCLGHSGSCLLLGRSVVSYGCAKWIKTGAIPLFINKKVETTWVLSTSQLQGLQGSTTQLPTSHLFVWGLSTSHETVFVSCKPDTWIVHSCSLPWTKARYTTTEYVLCDTTRCLGFSMVKNWRIYRNPAFPAACCVSGSPLGTALSHRPSLIAIAEWCKLRAPKHQMGGLVNRTASSKWWFSDFSEYLSIEKWWLDSTRVHNANVSQHTVYAWCSCAAVEHILRQTNISTEYIECCVTENMYSM